MEYLINIYQAAKILDYHPQTVRDLARKGIIPAVKRRQKWFFDPKLIKEWLMDNLESPSGNGNGQLTTIGDL